MQLQRLQDSGLEPLDPDETSGIFENWSTGGSVDLRKQLLTSVRIFIEEEMKVTLGQSTFVLHIGVHEASGQPITIPRPPLLMALGIGFDTADCTGVIGDLGSDAVVVYQHLYVKKSINQTCLIDDAVSFLYSAGTTDPLTETSEEYKTLLLATIEYWIRNRGSGIIKGPKGGIKIDKPLLSQYLEGTFRHMYKWTL